MKLKRIYGGLYQTPDGRFKVESRWIPPNGLHGGYEGWFWGPVVGKALGHNAYKRYAVAELEEWLDANPLSPA